MSLKNPVIPPGISPGTVRLVAERLNHYATPGPLSYQYKLEFRKTSAKIRWCWEWWHVMTCRIHFAFTSEQLLKSSLN